MPPAPSAAVAMIMACGTMQNSVATQAAVIRSALEDMARNLREQLVYAQEHQVDGVIHNDAIAEEIAKQLKIIEQLIRQLEKTVRDEHRQLDTLMRRAGIVPLPGT